MVPYYGDFAEDDTVNLPFNTFDSNDPSNSVTATDLVASDIFVHKDGSATAITTDGASIDIDAPGVGAHMITIDTSADAAYATGSEYAVRVNGVTVDGGTVNAWIGAFSIERAGGALAVAKTIKAETVLILADTAVIGAAGAGLTAINLPNQTMDIVGNITGNLSGSVGSLTGHTVQTGDTFALANGAAGFVAIDTVVDAILVDTAAMQPLVAKVPLSDGSITWNATALGSINTQVDTALTDIHLDHLMAAAAADVIVDGSVIAHMVSTTEDWSTFVPSTDSLQSIRDKQTDIEADTNELQADDYPTTIAAVQTTVDLISANVNDRMPSALTKGTADTGSTTTMVDSVRTEADTDYWKGGLIRFTSGTISGQVRVITGFTPASDTITFSPVTTQAVSTNTYEILPAGDVNRAILVDTTTTNTDAAAIQTVVDKIPLSDGSISWNATALAAINTEAADVLKTDVITLPGQLAPPLTPTFEEALAWIYKTLRNKKTQTSTTWSLYADNESTVDAKATVADDGTTASKAEIATGP